MTSEPTFVTLKPWKRTLSASDPWPNGAKISVEGSRGDRANRDDSPTFGGAACPELSLSSRHSTPGQRPGGPKAISDRFAPSRRRYACPRIRAEACPVPGSLPLSSGRPLDRLTREFFDHRFDFDFSRVRIHTDGEAAAGGKPEQDIPLTEFRDAYTTSPASALLDQPEKGKNLGPLARDTHVAVMEEPASETRGKWSKIVVIDGTKAGTVGWVKSDALAYK